MIEIAEVLHAVFNSVWFWLVIGGILLAEVAGLVAIKCKTPHWVPPASQNSNAGTREIRRLRNGQ